MTAIGAARARSTRVRQLGGALRDRDHDSGFHGPRADRLREDVQRRLQVSHRDTAAALAFAGAVIGLLLPGGRREPLATQWLCPRSGRTSVR